MDMNVFKTFLEVYRIRHFGKAADNLFITQAAVSARIQLLEKNLNVKLFQRNRNDIQPTPEGLRLRPYIEKILSNWDQATTAIALREDTRRTLKIGIEVNIWNNTLASWLSLIYKKFPNSIFKVYTTNSDTLKKYLLNGKLDLILSLDPPQQEALVSSPIADITLLMVSSQPNTRFKQSLEKGFIAVDWGKNVTADYHINPQNTTHAAIQIDTASAALDFLLNQGGQAYFAQQKVEKLLQKRLYQVTDAPEIKCTYYSTFSKNNNQKKTITTILRKINKRACDT
ncbi:MAG: LysR family transcriptional regulator [Cellvibrionaceae bacterium]|nr:LysR family transcriptional regulator [Cellvibrionaceae bacterium]